jgi:membrane protein YdbS with pleckstrin-like domain
MPINNCKLVKTIPCALICIAIAAVYLLPVPAMAYIGPGLGVAAIWVLLGPLAAIIVLIVIVGYYPARYLYKRYKYNRHHNSAPHNVGAEEHAQNDDDSSRDE